MLVGYRLPAQSPRKEKAPLWVVHRYDAFGCIPRMRNIARREDEVCKQYSKCTEPMICDTKADGECGVRVNNEVTISRSVLISWYISALPQYLVVPCTRGIRTPCTNNTPANLHASLRASGFGFVRSTMKKRQASK